ncbi:MAG: apolipoprotein N-acyltransferase [Cyclonatronaceae bacterium]
MRFFDVFRPSLWRDSIIRNKSRWGLSLSAGLLLGLSYSPFPFPFGLLSIIAFMLFFRLAAQSEGFRDTAYFSYAGFLLWNIITTYWLTMATVAGGVAAILANSALMALTLGLMKVVMKKLPSAWLGVPAAAAIWVSYEWLHLWWDLAWPWLALANAFARGTFMVQYIEWTGYLSITFMIVMTAGGLHQITRSQQPDIRKRWAWFTATVFLVPALVSVILLNTRDLQPDAYAQVVVAQPNYDSYLHNAGYPNTEIPLRELTAMIDSVVTDETDIMFWPENALMGRVDERRRSSNDVHLFQKAREWNVPIITGAAYFQYYEDEDAPRVHLRSRDGKAFNYYNSAVGFYPDGRLEVYNKLRLVPIVERMPFVTALSYLPLDVDWGGQAGYGKGREMRTFETNQADVSSPAIVCYDSVFPDVVRRSAEMDAGFITVITNDGWWGNTSGHQQHYDFARLRAVETRRAVVRSANNGISGMILPDGQPHTQTEYWTRTAFELDVPVYYHDTFYVRYGDWFPGLMSLMSLVSLGWCVLRKNASPPDTR